MTRIKRKATKKKIGGVNVVTNPKFTKDDETFIPSNLARQWADAVDTLASLSYRIFLAGVAIGRARATASGKSRKRKVTYV
jgi:hypothetical protein